jgi:23S rRNA pseudouridine1911/1915/1917 synthase
MSFIITSLNHLSVVIRLDKAVSNFFGISRTKASEHIKSGFVTVDGVVVRDGNHKVSEKNHIELSIIESEEKINLTPANIPLNIVYEDEQIIVLNKQVGLTVHPGAGTGEDTLVHALLYHFGASKLSSIAGSERAGIVHRLDRDTSGLMLIAKTDEAHNILSDDIANKRVKRIYQALVWGNITPAIGVISTNIARHNIERTKMQVVDAPSGKLAITHYNTLESYGYISLVQCQLETGRTHQIRVHLNHIGHSVVGDQIYGANNKKINLYYSGAKKEALLKFKRQALHSSFIEFFHPISKETLSFTAPVPQDLNELFMVL